MPRRQLSDGKLRRRLRSLCALAVCSLTSVALLQLLAWRMAAEKQPAPSLSPNLMRDFYDWQLLDVVQRRDVFADNKVFTDMPTISAPADVAREFAKRGLRIDSDIGDLRAFVNDNYLPVGSDVDVHPPPDWRQEAGDLLAAKVADPEAAELVRQVHLLWRSLSRRPNGLATSHPRRSSLVVPAGTESEWFIVPGGRFNELFYWDSYWILRGLAASGMVDTMRSMLNVLLRFVDQLGYAPNCARLYCLNRSHLPLLAMMLDAYLQLTGDWKYVADNYHLLEKEYDWWMSERRDTAVLSMEWSYTLNVYSPRASQPRAESYHADYDVADGVSGDARVQLFSDLTAACESGLDFSSRWMADSGRLETCETSNIAPVDLNAVMYKNELLLSRWAERLGDAEKSQRFAEAAGRRLKAMQAVLWDEETGCWYDFHLRRGERVSRRYYASNFVPLFTGAVHDPASTVPKVLRCLRDSGALEFKGGVPFSLTNSSAQQQWDFPNVWPPYQHMLVLGLHDQQLPEAKRLAKQLAGRWFDSVLAGWKRRRVMYEKLDCRFPGSPGFGGEYVNQIGFGWSNGVLLDFVQLGLVS